jgi:hypothetical protein
MEGGKLFEKIAEASIDATGFEREIALIRELVALKPCPECASVERMITRLAAFWIQSAKNYEHDAAILKGLTEGGRADLIAKATVYRCAATTLKTWYKEAREAVKP